MKVLKNLFAAIIGLLGAAGGSKNSSKALRRYGIPGLLTILAYVRLHPECDWLEAFWALTIMGMCGILSLGYGIPGGDDEGSDLGRFWYKITRNSHLWADILTRGTVGLGLALSLIVMPILLDSWVVYGLCSLGITLTWAFISWQPWGSFDFQFRGKEYQLCYSDLWAYTLLGVFANIIIWESLLSWNICLKF